MLAADTYPDYDGYTLYTTKGAAARPQPRWPDQDAATMQEVQSDISCQDIIKHSLQELSLTDMGRLSVSYWRSSLFLTTEGSYSTVIITTISYPSLCSSQGYCDELFAAAVSPIQS